MSLTVPTRFKFYTLTCLFGFVPMDVSVLPFQRMGPERMPVYAIHTTSIPQMIENKTVAADIKKKMDDLFITRLQHNINRLTKGGNQG